jgi:formate dehydrogenase maturation protein FdhE
MRPHDVAVQMLFIASMAGLTVAAFRWWPKIALLGALFFLTLSPSSSLVPIATEVGAERLREIKQRPDHTSTSGRSVVLRIEGDGGKRFLLCAFCAAEWEFRRIYCAWCGEVREESLPVFVAEKFAHVRTKRSPCTLLD